MSRWRVCEMERKAHNTVTEDPAVRCSCWQHVWRHSNGQQQQLLWEGGVCLIHCFRTVPDFPTLSRDLNQFSPKFCCCSFSCISLNQKERFSVHNKNAQNAPMCIQTDLCLKTQGLYNCIINLGPLYL